jgi:hypothetical protein
MTDPLKPKLVQIMFDNSVRTWKKTFHQYKGQLFYAV